MTRDVLAAQNVSRMCMVCGTQNPFSMHARFLEVEGGELVGLFEVRPEHQSYPGRLHGGAASAILDETIGRAINAIDPDAWGVTIELTVKYRRPVPVDGTVRAIARITKSAGRSFVGTGEIVLPDGSVAVEASGRYLRLPIERITEGDFETEWFPDERDVPEEVEI